MPRNLCAIRAFARLPFLFWVLALGACLFWPALRSPLVLDDYLQLLMAKGHYVVPRDPWDLYNFIDLGDSEVLRARGFLPWWADSELRIRFLRPLPSLLLWTEYRLGLSPFAMHLHSLCWWGTAVALASKLYAGRLPQRAVRLAVFIFALGPFQVVPLAWLANREALVSLSFGIAALLVHWGGNGLRRAALATLLFCAAFASGEYAFGLCGYVLAEACVLHASWPKRLLRVLPAFAPASIYLLVRAGLGCGAGGSGFYTDPFKEPWLFAARAPLRFVRMVMNALGGLDGELLRESLPRVALAVFALAWCFLLVEPLRQAWRTPQWRVFLLGSALSLAPALAVVPSPRLLGMAMFGLAPLVGLLLNETWWGLRAPNHAMRFAALALGFTLLVHGPFSSWLMARSWRHSGEGFARDAAALRRNLGPSSDANVTVVRGIAGAFFVPFALAPGEPPPRAWRLLAQLGHVLVRRTGPKDIELLAPKEQSLVPIVAGNLFRPEGKGFVVGTRFEVPGMTVTVLETNPSGVRRASFHFDSVEDCAWMAESSRGFELFSLPDVGFGKQLEP